MLTDAIYKSLTVELQLTDNWLLIIAKGRIFVTNDTIGQFTESRTTRRTDHLLPRHLTLTRVRIAPHRIGNDIANFWK